MLPLRPGDVPLDSSIPGGRVLHQTVARLVSRQTHGLAGQVQTFADAVRFDDGGSMSGIHQVIVGAGPGDAVTGAALEFRALLRQAGPSDIYAQYIHPALDGDVLPLAAYSRPGAGRGQLLIYHSSIGDPAVNSFLRAGREDLVLVYHNITPAAWYADHDPAFARLLALGRDELTVLRPRCRLALAVSAYNAAELTALDYPDVRVSPLVVDTGRLLGVEPDPTITHRLAEEAGGPTILFVGQVLPHKRPDLLLQAYHLLVTEIIPEANLALIGSQTALPRYARLIHRLAEELNLSRAWLPGAVSPAELAAYYRGSRLFVTLSEHEGFCLPLVEAMACALPVLARACAAIPDTMGGVPLVLAAAEGPELIAEAMAALLEDEPLRKRCAEAGLERIRAFDPDRARAIFVEHLLRVV